LVYLTYEFISMSLFISGKFHQNNVDCGINIVSLYLPDFLVDVILWAIKFIGLKLLK